MFVFFNNYFILNLFQISYNINIFVYKLKIAAAIKKIFKIFFGFLGGVVLFLLVAYAVMHSSGVQTRLVRFFNERIKENTGVDISIGGVDFCPVKSLVLTDVLVKDLRNDTLVYSKSIALKIDSLNILSRSFKVTELTFDNTYFNLWMSRGEEESVMNVEELLEALLPQEEKSHSASTKSNWMVGLKNIHIRNSRLDYKEEDYESVGYGINWTDIECRDLNMDIVSPHSSDGVFKMNVLNLSLKEKSGFVVQRLDGKIQLEGTHLEVCDIVVKTGKSDLNLKKLTYDWQADNKDWRYFTSRIKQYYEVEESHVSFTDLAYFNERLVGINNTFTCRGIISNTVHRIEGHQLVVKFGTNSIIEAEATSAGLPYFFSTLFNINIKRAIIYPEDLEMFYYAPLDYRLDVPAPLHQLDCFHLSGRFKGTVRDFETQLQSYTEGLKGGFLFVYKDGENDSLGRTLLSGEYDFEEVDVQKLSGIEYLGDASLKGNYKGRVQNGALAIQTQGHVNSFLLNGARIGNGDVRLRYNNGRFDLKSRFNDQLIKAEVALKGYMGEKNTKVEMKSQLDLPDLSRFNMALTDQPERLTTELELFFAGKVGDQSETVLRLKDFTYNSGSRVVALDSLMLYNNESSGHYNVKMESDIIDATVEGQGVFSSSFSFFKKQLKDFLPIYTLETDELNWDPATFKEIESKYYVYNKDVNRVLQVFYPGFSLSQGAVLSSEIKGEEESFNLYLKADTLSYKYAQLLDPKFQVNGTGEKLDLTSSLGTVKLGEIFNIHNVYNQFVVVENQVDASLSWSNWEEKTYSGDLSAQIKFVPGSEQKYKTEVKFNPGIVVVGDSIWNLRKSSLTIEDGNLDVKRFALTNEEQYMGVSGKITGAPEDLFSVKLRKMDLNKLNKMFFNSQLGVFGIVDGKIDFKDNVLHSDIDIKNWGIGKDTIGEMKLTSYWDKEDKKLIIKSENRVGDKVPFSISGHYVPATEDVDLKIVLEELDLHYVREYITDFCKDSKGRLSGVLEVKGNVSDFDLYGYLALDSVALTLLSLNTAFLVNDSIYFQGDSIYLQNFVIEDVNGSRALLNGYYDFIKKGYGLDMITDNFLLMNTKLEHNEQLYGKAFVSSIINIAGKEGITKVSIDARPEANSELYIPLTGFSSASENNFLHFVNSGYYHKASETQDAFKFKDVLLNANLELNDNLKIFVVFDPSIGDVLRASGSGDIKIDLENDGGIKMFGEYKLSKGNYSLTLGGLVDKSFTLKPGGSIKWNGSPYDALIDVDAIYHLKTSLNELFASGNDFISTTDRSTKVPVECVLGLRENILDPVVEFDIHFPSLDAQARSYVQSLFSSQDEKNKQMFSLLVLNRFYKPDYMADLDTEERNVGYQAGMTTASEILSNQLSRWLSGINNNFDIGFVYRPGSEMTADEVELALSTQLLNDRVTISVNGNMDVGNTKNSENPNASNNVVGDFDIELKLNQDGTLKLKAYSHTDEKIIYKSSNETTQGIGVSYQETFDTFRELFSRYTGFLKKKNKKETPDENLQKELGAGKRTDNQEMGPDGEVTGS